MFRDLVGFPANDQWISASAVWYRKTMGTNGKKPGAVKRFFAALGPGLVSGAADDDPSGIATYSIAGAKFGTNLLWTAFFTWPLMVAVQMMCARIGMVTGEGLAEGLRKKLPKTVVLLFAVGLLVANTINIGADLAGMGDAVGVLTGWNGKLFVVAFGFVSAVTTVWIPYRLIARILKWLALALFAYIFTAFLAKPDWTEVVKDTFFPSWAGGSAFFATLVAILGTTISPYLFYWQTAEEVEEEECLGRDTVEKRRGATKREINDRRLDVSVGGFFSNLVMYFIILATALTLHRHGITDIASSKDAAEALRPIAGPLATWLYALGLLGVGFLAIPTLSSSVAYALAAAFGWKQGLSEKPGRARAFYGIIVFSTVVGILLDFMGVPPVRALFLSAVVNGVLAPFLLVGILLVDGDAEIMRGQPSTKASRWLVMAATVVMFAAAAAMFVF